MKTLRSDVRRTRRRRGKRTLHGSGVECRRGAAAVAPLRLRIRGA